MIDWLIEANVVPGMAVTENEKKHMNTCLMEAMRKHGKSREWAIHKAQSFIVANSHIRRARWIGEMSYNYVQQ